MSPGGSALDPQGGEGAGRGLGCGHGWAPRGAGGKRAGVIWVENWICCSSVEMSSLEGTGIWSSAVSTHSSIPRTLLWEGKRTFFPHSLHFPIPNSLLPHISMCFFPLFCLESKRERIRGRAGRRGVQGDLFPSSNTDFSDEHLQRSQILLLKLLFPSKEKEEPKETLPTTPLAEMPVQSRWQTGFGFISERTFPEG